MGAVVGSMVGPLMARTWKRVSVSVGKHFSVGLMGDESSRERIIGLMGAVVGSMVGPLMAAEKQSSEGGLLER
jgi:uncharacterized membrane protein YeaQ/YmgE (transglycosylase-associated protein family)